MEPTLHRQHMSGVNIYSLWFCTMEFDGDFYIAVSCLCCSDVSVNGGPVAWLREKRKRKRQRNTWRNDGSIEERMLCRIGVTATDLTCADGAVDYCSRQICCWWEERLAWWECLRGNVSKHVKVSCWRCKRARLFTVNHMWTQALSNKLQMRVHA